MHFLSHYYTEMAETHPLTVVGLALPDLTPGFTWAYNAVLKKADTVLLTPELQPIQLGVELHYSGDKKFHTSDLFKQLVTEATQSMVNEGLNREKLRLSVLAHVGMEMLIDRQIVLQQPHVCNQYYELVDKAPETTLISYFNRFKLEKEKEVFLTRLAFFKEKRFLWKLNELENILVGLERIYGSVTKSKFTDDEKTQLTTAFHNIDGVIRYRWQDLLRL